MYQIEIICNNGANQQRWGIIITEWADPVKMVKKVINNEQNQSNEENH